MPHEIERRIVIVGSGFSGICLGMKLKLAGIESFTILEKADRLGMGCSGIAGPPLWTSTSRRVKA